MIYSSPLLTPAGLDLSQKFSVDPATPFPTADEMGGKMPG
jgi:hypothetical protein